MPDQQESGAERYLSERRLDPEYEIAFAKARDDLVASIKGVYEDVDIPTTPPPTISPEQVVQDEIGRWIMQHLFYSGFKDPAVSAVVGRDVDGRVTLHFDVEYKKD